MKLVFARMKKDNNMVYKYSLTSKVHSLLQIIICTILLFPIILNGQNFVPNPSFEEITKCPDDVPDVQSNVKFCEYWSSLGKGSPDYYNACIVGNRGVPKNESSYQEAHTGGAYMGMLIDGNIKWEYIQCKLIQPLKQGKKYCFSMYINLPDDLKFSTNEITVAITKEKLEQKRYKFIKCESYISLKSKTFYEDKKIGC